MGRTRLTSEEGLRKGAWTAMEDQILTEYIKIHGEGKWRNISKETGLKRSGKSCRLRWLNYLRPDIKRGNISPEEDDLIIRLHKLLGNRWSLIAGRLPRRTDNEIKNYWNTKLSKKLNKSNNQAELMSEDETKKRKINQSPSMEESSLVQKGATTCKVPGGQNIDTKVVATQPLTIGVVKEDDDVGSKTSGSTSLVLSERTSSEDLTLDFDFGEFLLSDFEFWRFDNFTDQLSH